VKRLFWLGAGVAAGVALSRKAKQKVQDAPSGVAASLGDALGELAGAIGAFGADVRAGMSEREEELADVVERRSGVTPGARRALGAGHRATTRPDARARRADGRP
jgi:hypothetical protein